MNLIEVGKSVPVKDIKISPYHFRKETVRENLERLAKSIQQVGLIHAVSVVRDEKALELVNGHRRLEAHKLAGLSQIRANIYEFAPAEAADEPTKQQAITQFLFAANQSEPLVPVERARYYRDAIEKLGLSLAELSEIHNQSAEQIESDMRYLNIAQPVLDLIAAAPQKFSTDHLEILAEYSSASKKKAWRITPEEQERIAKKVLAQEDKRIVASPHAFEAEIREMVRERRAKAEEIKKRLKAPRTQVDSVKELVRAVEEVEKAVKGLDKVDLSLINEIELVDKREIMSRLYSLSETLVGFAERRINPLKVKRHAEAVKA